MSDSQGAGRGSRIGLRQRRQRGSRLLSRRALPGAGGCAAGRGVKPGKKGGIREGVLPPFFRLEKARRATVPPPAGQATRRPSVKSSGKSLPG